MNFLIDYTIMENKRASVSDSPAAYSSEHSWEVVFERQRRQLALEILPVIFHQLKNKLTPILGYAQILLAQCSEDKTRGRLEKIEQGAEDLTGLLNTLRDYFSPEQTVFRPENLNLIISELQPFQDGLQEAFNLDLVFEPSEIPALLLQPNQIEVMTCELLYNAALAVKSSGKASGMIRVATSPLGDGARLQIEDNGCGLDQEAQKRVFSPFFALFPDRAGLGLTICEKVAQYHRAEISFFSLPGEKTTVTVDFPGKTQQEQSIQTKKEE